MREVASEDGGSATSRKRKEPHKEEREGRDRDKERDRERERERERDKEREKDKEYRERERERDRKDYDRGTRSSRHHRYDDRENYKSRHREDDRRRDSGRKSSRVEFHGKEWDGTPTLKRERERSMSVYKEDGREKRELDKGSHEDRAEKVRFPCLCLLRMY